MNGAGKKFSLHLRGVVERRKSMKKIIRSTNDLLLAVLMGGLIIQGLTPGPDLFVG